MTFWRRIFALPQRMTHLETRVDALEELAAFLERER